MPDMGLPLAYGAGTGADELARLVKERLLIQEQQRRQAELEWQRQYQGGMLNIAGDRNAIDREQFAAQEPERQARVRGLTASAAKTEQDTSQAAQDAAEEAALAQDPVLGPILRARKAGAAPIDTQLEDKQQQAMELAKFTRGTQWGTAGIQARAGEGRLGRGQIRTVPNTISEGNFGVPAGTPVTAIMVIGPDGAERVGELPSGMTAGQKEQATALESVGDLLGQVRALWQASRGTTGPVMGRLEKMAGRVGTNIDPRRAEIAALLQSARNRAIYALSGKQINETEYVRLMDEMPDINQDDATFELRLNNAENAIRTPMSRLGRVGTGPLIGQTPEIGEQRIVNGQLAEWDGRGWKAVR